MNLSCGLSSVGKGYCMLYARVVIRTLDIPLIPFKDGFLATKLLRHTNIQTNTFLTWLNKINYFGLGVWFWCMNTQILLVVTFLPTDDDQSGHDSFSTYGSY